MLNKKKMIQQACVKAKESATHILLPCKVGEFCRTLWLVSMVALSRKETIQSNFLIL